jgi:hypothetical protein
MNVIENKTVMNIWHNFSYLIVIVVEKTNPKDFKLDELFILKLNNVTVYFVFFVVFLSF